MSINIHSEKDWRRFFESLQFASTKLNRLKKTCIVPDIIFINKQYNPSNKNNNPLTWYSQQKTAKGEGVFQVKATQTTPYSILARLDRHLITTIGETIQPQTDRIAAIGIYHDKQSLLTFGEVNSMLTQITSTNNTDDMNMIVRPPDFPFCFYFVTPPGLTTRFVATSMSSQREGTLLGQNTGISISHDWYERRNVTTRPKEWGLLSKETINNQDNDTNRSRAVMNGMRQLCRCLSIPRFDVDIRISIRGIILEFMFDRVGNLCWSGIVSMVTVIDKPIHTPRKRATSGVEIDQDDGIHLEEIPYPDLVMDPNTYKLTTPTSMQTSMTTSMTSPMASPMASPMTTSMATSMTTSMSKAPSRPDTAPSSRRQFTPTGRPISTTKRIGGGHSYQMTVENMTSTKYTGTGTRRNNSNRNRTGRRTMSSTKASKSILMAHGARHCEPPALIAMAHQIDGLNGDLQSSIRRGKELQEDVREREHMLEVVNDHSKQLSQRIDFLENELKETKEKSAAREAELLLDLFETKKALEKMTKENHGLKVVLEQLQGKLNVVEKSAVEERETIMRRMVEYDHQNRTLTADLEKRENEVTSLSGALAKERAANEALKLQLADLQEDVDSMGMSNQLAMNDIKDVTEERNDLYRNSSGPPPLQYKKGNSFKLYAWDIMASHPNPRAELEIVYSVFTHFNITLSQIYVHYATSSTTVFTGGRKKMRGSGGRLRLLMCRTDFRNFSREAKIMDAPLFPYSFIDLAYAKSILGGTRKGGREVVLEASNLNGGTRPRKERFTTPQGTMTKRDFKEALLRLSHARFPHLANVGEKLVVLFEKHIIPYCESALLPEYSDEDDAIVKLGKLYESGFTDAEGYD